VIRCRLPRYLVRHVKAEGGEVRAFEANGVHPAGEQPPHA
jgi:hypothetical protein